MTESDIPRRTELTSPLAIAAYRSGYVYAVVSGLMGIAGMLGELPGLARLAQPLAGWPRLPLLASIALVAIGFALWQFLQQRYRSAFLAALIAELTAVLSLVAQVAPIAISHDAMALASAVLVLAAATPLAVVSARRRLLPEDASVGIAGFVLLAVAATLLIARATGMTNTTIDMLGAGPSLQVLIAGFLIGSCYVALVWSRGLLSGDSATWLPTALGIAGLVTVVVLWRGLTSRENDQVVALTRQAGEERRRVLVREAVVTAHSLHRASEWRAAGASFGQQRRDIAALQRDVPGLEAAGWISSLGVIDTVTSPSLAGVGADSVTLAYVNRNARLPDTIAFLPLDTATKRFVILAPACAINVCSGTMVAVMRTARLFRDVIPDTSRGFHYAIIGRAGRLAGPAADSDATRQWIQWLGLDSGAVHATLAAWPTQETVDGVRSSLPLLVLLMGFVVSGLVPVSVRFAQRSLRSVRDLERSRITAALERTTDGIWEWDLLTGGSVHSSGHLALPGIRSGIGAADPRRVDRARASRGSAAPRPRDPGASQRRAAQLRGRVPRARARWQMASDRGSRPRGGPHGQRPSRAHGRHQGRRDRRALGRAGARGRRAALPRGVRQRLPIPIAARPRRPGGGDQSTRAGRLRRRRRDDVRGKLAWNTLWWQGNAEAQERLRSATAAAARGLTRRYEEEFSGPGGEATHIEIAVKSLTGESEEHTQLLLEARDLTARRRAEATLREVETLTTMGRVAAQVAHEINNPLAGIQNSFLLIKGAIPATHPHYKYVGAIEREVARIAAVTRQLYETYRPEHDSQAGAAIATVIGDAVSFLEQVNRATGVHVVVELGRGPLDPAAARRAAPADRLQPGAERDRGVAERRHRDRAHHREQRPLRIARARSRARASRPKSRERIFEPFYSTKSGRLRTGGMGLGLALVRRTVTAAGGTIGVHDVEGEGCEFVVTLPLHATKEETA